MGLKKRFIRRWVALAGGGGVERNFEYKVQFQKKIKTEGKDYR